MEYIKDAFALSIKRSGEKLEVLKMRVKAKLFHDAKIKNRSQLMGRLYHGKNKDKTLSYVVPICEELKITPNELFQWAEKNILIEEIEQVLSKHK